MGARTRSHRARPDGAPGPVSRPNGPMVWPACARCATPQLSRAAWQQLIVDAERFLDSWGIQAARLGWPAWELFGCHRRAPWGRIQGMGLVLLLRGERSRP